MHRRELRDVTCKLTEFLQSHVLCLKKFYFLTNLSPIRIYITTDLEVFFR